MSEKRTPKLTMELISNILHRLPAKPLAQYKCVSKAWYSLLHSRAFILRHVTRSLTTTTNLHFTRLGRSKLATVDLPSPNSTDLLWTHTICLPFTTRAPDSDFIGSCHGLLLISDHPNFLALCSPTTDTYHVFPVRDPPQGPESHWVDYGLGFDPSSDNYKVVRIDQHNGPGQRTRAREVQVYTLKGARSRWRKIEANFPHYLAHPKGHGKFLEKSLHWIGITTPPTVYDYDTKMRLQSKKPGYNYVIVGLDLSTERFHEIEMPNLSKAWWKRNDARPSLYVVGEKLLVQISYLVGNKLSVDLWLMNEYGVKNSWVKLCNLEAEYLVSAMAISEEGGGGGVEVLFEKHDPSQAFFSWYNVKRKEFRDIEVAGDLPTLFEWRGGHPCCYGAVVYAESLVTLDDYYGLDHAEPEDSSNAVVLYGDYSTDDDGDFCEGDDIGNGVLPLFSVKKDEDVEMAFYLREPRRLVDPPVAGFGTRLN